MLNYDLQRLKPRRVFEVHTAHNNHCYYHCKHISRKTTSWNFKTLNHFLLPSIIMTRINNQRSTRFQEKNCYMKRRYTVPLWDGESENIIPTFIWIVEGIY